jgi:hypothetical protein
MGKDRWAAMGKKLNMQAMAETDKYPRGKEEGGVVISAG